MRIDAHRIKRKFTLISEENGAAIISSEENDVVLFRPDIHDRSLRKATSQVLGLDREELVGSQISEIQHWRPAALLH